jgi:hypothetical protein
MALENRDFTIEQGSSFILQFDLTDDDGNSLGTVVNNALGSFSFAMNCRRSKYGGLTLPLVDISGVTMLGTAASSDQGNTRDGFYVYQGLPGRIKFVLSSPTTAAMKFGMHDYEIEVRETKTSGTQYTKAMGGKMTVLAESTN